MIATVSVTHPQNLSSERSNDKYMTAEFNTFETTFVESFHR